MEFVAEVAEEVKELHVAENAESNDEEEVDAEEGAGGSTEAAKKKRKKKKKSKSKKDTNSQSGIIIPASFEETKPHCRLLGGSTNYFLKYGQTFPPTIPVGFITHKTYSSLRNYFVGCEII